MTSETARRAADALHELVRQRARERLLLQRAHERVQRQARQRERVRRERVADLVERVLQVARDAERGAQRRRVVAALGERRVGRRPQRGDRLVDVDRAERHAVGVLRALDRRVGVGHRLLAKRPLRAVVVVGHRVAVVLLGAQRHREGDVLELVADPAAREVARADGDRLAPDVREEGLELLQLGHLALHVEGRARAAADVGAPPPAAQPVDDLAVLVHRDQHDLALVGAPAARVGLGEQARADDARLPLVVAAGVGQPRARAALFARRRLLALRGQRAVRRREGDLAQPHRALGRHRHLRGGGRLLERLLGQIRVDEIHQGALARLGALGVPRGGRLARARRRRRAEARLELAQLARRRPPARPSRRPSPSDRRRRRRRRWGRRASG